MNKLLTLAVAAMISTPALAADDPNAYQKAGYVLPLCDSSKEWEQLICFSHVQATYNSFTFLWYSVDTDPGKTSGIAGICQPVGQKLDLLGELIPDAIQMLKDERASGAHVLADGPPSWLLLAAMRKRFPCKK